MKKYLILIFVLLSFYSYSQDLYIQYFDSDQKETLIKAVWITDINGTKKEKDFPAKSQIHLIKLIEERGYKFKDIQVGTYPNALLTKYHIWFDKIN